MPCFRVPIEICGREGRERRGRGRGRRREGGEGRGGEREGGVAGRGEEEKERREIGRVKGNEGR